MVSQYLHLTPGTRGLLKQRNKTKLNKENTEKILIKLSTEFEHVSKLNKTCSIIHALLRTWKRGHSVIKQITLSSSVTRKSSWFVKQGEENDTLISVHAIRHIRLWHSISIHFALLLRLWQSSMIATQLLVLKNNTDTKLKHVSLRLFDLAQFWTILAY